MSMSLATLGPLLRSLGKNMGVEVLSRDGDYIRRMETVDAYEIRCALPRKVVSVKLAHGALEDMQPGAVADALVRLLERAKDELHGQLLRSIFDTPALFENFRCMLFGLTTDEQRESSERYALQFQAIADSMMRKAKKLGA